MPTTDHGSQIRTLRGMAMKYAADCADLQDMDPTRQDLADASNVYALAADLLEMHDQTGISLDGWSSARALVERLIEGPITENGV